MKPNVLVIGSGAREHAIIQALLRGGDVGKIYSYPGNGGISQLATIVPSYGKPLRIFELRGFAIAHSIELTIVGTEAWLIDGIADSFEEADKLLLGPTKSAAQLEGSKIFAKKFMKRHGIPTANFDVCFTADDAMEAARNRHYKCVIKADGPCGGNGVYACDKLEDVIAAIRALMIDRVHGKAGTSIVVEDKLAGTESSFFLLADGKTYIEFGTAGDHKRANDGDEGPNTGGMGAFSPCPFITEELRNQILLQIVEPTFSGMVEEGNPFTGFLFIGLMLTAEGLKVLEYNVRLGDPETQVILPRLLSSAYEIFSAAATGNLSEVNPIWSDERTVGVNLTSQNYPEKDVIENEITGISDCCCADDLEVYHAATIRKNEKFFATGGRIMTVVGRKSTYLQAKQRAYDGAHAIHFQGMRMRNDIANRAIGI